MKDRTILNTAFDIINLNGLENFSMRKLACELQCQPASIYHHYANKNDILNSLYVSLYQDYFADFFSVSNIRESLKLACKKVQTDRETFLFLKKYRKAAFLTEESLEIIKQCQMHHHECFERNLELKSQTITNYLIAMGPVSEIAVMNLELDDDDIELLVSKIMLGLEGGL